MKPMARIECVYCGAIQGSMVCFSCRKKVAKLLAQGKDPETIVKIMMVPRHIQTPLEWFFDVE